MAQSIFGSGIASYMTVADGNISTGANWALIDSISAIDGVANQFGSSYFDFTQFITSTTSYQTSATWAYASSPPTIDGIALRITTLGTITGTITVALDKAGVDVAGTVCTCNISDLPANGWAFFKLSAPVTLTVATYGIKFKTSTAGTVNIKSDPWVASTAWCRLLRTTTTGTAPSAASTQKDNMYVVGEITGAGTVTSRTMTWDITNSSFPYGQLSIGGLASTVNVQNSASTNYWMFLQWDLRIYSGGTLNIGTSGTPIVSTSTFTLSFKPTAGGGSASSVALLVYNGGTLNAYGPTKGTTKTLLASNAAAAATSISVVAATDWAIGDILGIAATSTSPSECEERTITSVSGTTIGIAALTNAHLGTTPKIGEVVNLSRKILFTGTTTSGQQGWLACFAGSSVTLRYVEFTSWGTTTATAEAFYMNANLIGTGVDIQYCSFHDANSFTVLCARVDTLSGPIIFSNNVTYNTGNSCFVTNLSNTFTGTLTVDNNTFIKHQASGPMVTWGLGLPTATFTNNTITGFSGGSANGALNITAVGVIGTMSGNTIHSTTSSGVYVNGAQTATATLNWVSSNWTIWCNSAVSGIQIPVAFSGAYINIDGYTAFSNQNGALQIDQNLTGQIILNNMQFQAGTLPVSQLGLYLTGSATAASVMNITITNSNMGDVSAHSNADILMNKTVLVNITGQNVKLGSTTKIGGLSNMFLNSAIAFDRYQQTNGNYALFLPNGTITRDTTIFNTATPSIRVTPTSTTAKISGGVFYVAVPNGVTCTVSIKVRKSVVGDGVAYNGNQPRLILPANPQAGFTTTTVLQTASAAAGTWETLTGTIPAVNGDSLVAISVDCDGTAGWINIDDFSSSQILTNQGNMNFSHGGQSFAVIGSGAGVTNTVTPLPLPRRKAI